MKCQNLFFGKNKKHIVNLLTAEFAQRLVTVIAPVIKAADNILIFFYLKNKKNQF